MRHLPVFTLVLLALVVLMPRPAAAQQLDFWVGFGGIQTQSMIAVTPEGRISGKTRYIDVVVGHTSPARRTVTTRAATTPTPSPSRFLER